MTPVDLLKSINATRDLETIPVTRGQLVDILTRLHIAEGMRIEQAKIHARCLVDHHFIQVKTGSS